MNARSNILRLAIFGLLISRAPRGVQRIAAYMLLGVAIAVVLIALAVSARGDDPTLPQAMRGTWCPQPDDERGTPMTRCAPGSPDSISMTRHAMDTHDGRCRVVSVRTLSTTRWVIAVDCEAEPDRTYGWQFFRDGETLYLTPVGGFVPK